MMPDWRVSATHMGGIQAEQVAVQSPNTLHPAMTGVELLERLVEFDRALRRACQFLVRINMFLPHRLHSCAVPARLFLECYKRFRPGINYGDWEKVCAGHLLQES